MFNKKYLVVGRQTGVGEGLIKVSLRNSRYLNHMQKDFSLVVSNEPEVETGYTVRVCHKGSGQLGLEIIETTGQES